MRYQHLQEIPLYRQAGCTQDQLSQPTRSAARPCQGMTYGSQSSRQAKPLPASSCSFVVLAHHGQVWQKVSSLLHFGHRPALLKQRAGWADVYTFAATGTSVGRTPRRVQIGNHVRPDAATHHVPGMRAFDLVTHAHATTAQDAAIVIDDKPVMGGINSLFWIAIGKVNVSNAEPLGH